MLICKSATGLVSLAQDRTLSVA